MACCGSYECRPAAARYNERTDGGHQGYVAAGQANLARVRQLLAAPEPETVRDETTGAAAAPIDHRPRCPCCGGRMIIVETFERGGGPRDPP